MLVNTQFREILKMLQNFLKISKKYEKIFFVGNGLLFPDNFPN